MQRFEFNQPQMGLPFRIVLYAPNEKAAETAATAAFKRIQELNDIMSDYEEDSELTRLSRTAGQGRPIKLSDDLWKVLKRAQEVSEASHGAFDVTVGPCVTAWRKARREKRFPNSVSLQMARLVTGFRNLKLDSLAKTAELTVPNMRLDLGGIAKGYAVDEAQKVLKKFKVKSALVLGGGDIAVSAPPPGKKSWRIEIAELDEKSGPNSVVHLRNAALATSGDTFQFVELDGKRYSHIVDPRTGVGLTDYSLVHIIAPSCMMADAFSTAVSVLGPVEGMKLVENERVAARIQRWPAERLQNFESSRFKRFYEPR